MNNTGAGNRPTTRKVVKIMKYTATIYKEIYDYNAGFMTLRKVETVTGTKEEILKAFHEYIVKYPNIKYHYTLD